MALAAVHRRLRYATFKQTIEWLDDQRRKIGRNGQERSVQDLIDIFYAARPWFPVPPICRLDAAALCMFLWRNNQEADLVFGVRLQPFLAHCWVQHKETVLNEPFDKVRPYSHIMVV